MGDGPVGRSASSTSRIASSSVTLVGCAGWSDGSIDEGPLAISDSGISCAVIVSAGAAVSITNGPATRPDNLRILTPDPIAFKLEGLCRPLPGEPPGGSGGGGGRALGGEVNS